MSYGAHSSVLLQECLDFLALGADVHPSPLFADLTFGAGGHTLALAARFPTAKIIAFDQDPQAIANGKEILQKNKLENRIELVHHNFSHFPRWCEENKMPGFQGILLDLGVSSHQLDTAERGFSFRFDAPLDMRMNPESGGPTGADLLNQLPLEELAKIIFEYGEERYSRKIAQRIVELRTQEKITNTQQLENIAFHVYPAHQRHKKPHPATRTFQALRIAVNDELGKLQEILQEVSLKLAPMGTLSIISFHSLEDRIVKHKFKDLVDKEENQVKILTKKPVVPSDQEMDENPRSRSAKLRVLQKHDN
jgi:16S rRNA (cytosine1402-N4)-methyltransferase